jgi:23S rRNA pseudouridine1911/1915/1917 synthase
MTDHVEFTVETAKERLDKLILAQMPHLTRTQAQNLIKQGLVTVDGATVKSGVKLRGGEVIRVVIEKPEEDIAVEAEEIPLDILYQDDDLAIINKPAGLVVHPAIGNTSGTLVNALLHEWSQIGDMEDEDHRHGIVHRLDKDTSGVMIVAKTMEALENLKTQFQERTVDKRYIAMLERTPNTPEGRIEAPIGRDPRQRKRMSVQRDGKPAITEFVVLDDTYRDGATLVEFKLLTGRTHQIRVHAAFIGCPVIGDRVYGFRKQRSNKFKRNFLHASEISFDHPRTGERMSFSAPLPPVLEDFKKKLRE